MDKQKSNLDEEIQMMADTMQTLKYVAVFLFGMAFMGLTIFFAK